jgi:hypothetical protein
VHINQTYAQAKTQSTSLDKHGLTIKSQQAKRRESINKLLMPKFCLNVSLPAKFLGVNMGGRVRAVNAPKAGTVGMGQNGFSWGIRS